MFQWSHYYKKDGIDDEFTLSSSTPLLTLRSQFSMEWSESARIAAEKNGLTLAEFVVLQQAKYRAGFNAERMASVIVAECDLLDLPFDENDYLDAIESCMRKDLLRVLTDADLDDSSDLGTTFSFPDLSFRGYQAGAVDFTPRGFQLTLKLLADFNDVRQTNYLADYLNFASQQVESLGNLPTLTVYGTCAQLASYLTGAADRIAAHDYRYVSELLALFAPDSVWYNIVDEFRIGETIFSLLQRLKSSLRS